MFGFRKKKRRTMNEEEEKKAAGESETPESPATPESSEKPENPESPESPENPENPESPETPENPESLENPENPATPENPETPEKPAEPNWKDQYARMLADFDNYRKRVARDREELAQFAAKDILKDLLPTVDNLALALEKAENKDDPFVQGVKLAYDGFLKALADHGATPIDSVGEPFDANFHDALAQLPSPDVAEGIVMNEVKRGWLLHGKLLRAAQVVVSSGAPEKPAENPAAEA